MKFFRFIFRKTNDEPVSVATSKQFNDQKSTEGLSRDITSSECWQLYENYLAETKFLNQETIHLNIKLKITQVQRK